MKKKPLNWLAKKAMKLLQADHVFVITYHFFPFVGTNFVKHLGLYSTRTGNRVKGVGLKTFRDLRDQLADPFLVPMIHPPCPVDERENHPPDKVFTLQKENAHVQRKTKGTVESLSKA